MIDRADAGREPQPFRRVHGDGRIEDHHERDDAGMNIGLLQPQPRLGDAGTRVEFAAAERRRHADLPHPRRAVLREVPLACDLVDHGAEGFQPVRLANVVFQADGDRLAAVGRRPAADTQQQVAAGIARLVGAGDHRVARAVRRHLVMHAGVARPQRVGDPADRIGFPVERPPGEDEYPPGAEPIGRLGHRIGGRTAEHHAFHSREDDLARAHGIDVIGWPRGGEGERARVRAGPKEHGPAPSVEVYLALPPERKEPANEACRAVPGTDPRRRRLRPVRVAGNRPFHADRAVRRSTGRARAAPTR